MTGRGRRVGGPAGDGRGGGKGGKFRAGKGWCAMVAVSGLRGAFAKRGGVQWWLYVHREVPLQAPSPWQRVEEHCRDLKHMPPCSHICCRSAIQKGRSWCLFAPPGPPSRRNLTQARSSLLGHLPPQ